MKRLELYSNKLSSQLKESGHLGVHGAHAPQAATRGLGQDIEVSLEGNHALEVHLILETVIVSHNYKCS